MKVESRNKIASMIARQKSRTQNAADAEHDDTRTTTTTGQLYSQTRSGGDVMGDVAGVCAARARGRGLLFRYNILYFVVEFELLNKFLRTSNYNIFISPPKETPKMHFKAHV